LQQVAVCFASSRPTLGLTPNVSDRRVCTTRCIVMFSPFWFWWFFAAGKRRQVATDGKFCCTLLANEGRLQPEEYVNSLRLVAPCLQTEAGCNAAVATEKASACCTLLANEGRLQPRPRTVPIVAPCLQTEAGCNRSQFALQVRGQRSG